VYPYKCGFIVICGLLKNAKTADNTDVGVMEHSSKSQQTGYGGFHIRGVLHAQRCAK